MAMGAKYNKIYKTVFNSVKVVVFVLSSLEFELINTTGMFIHSIKVPRFYKETARIAKKVKEDGASIKVLIYEKKHTNLKGIYALVINTLQRLPQLEFLMKKSKILENESRLDPWLARILITELLWGKKQLPGGSKPIMTVLAYEQILKAHGTDIHAGERKIKVRNPRYVRVNTLKLSLDEAVEGFRDEGWTFSRHMDGGDYAGFLERVARMGDDEFLVDIHLDNLLVFPPGAQFYQHSAYLDGRIMLQDKASCLPVQILNPTEGSVALDMCAAPGMKTTQLAAHMNNTGSIYAVEMDKKRLETLNKMLETAGVTCATVLNKDVVTVTSQDIPGVEYILVDPTCSGSGIVNRIEVENNFEPVEQRVARLAGFQIKILKHALKRFPDAKRVVYSTCSMYPQENEDVVAEIISSCTKFKLVPVQNLLKAPWTNLASHEEGSVGSHCIYARPEDDLTNGFFVAAFERLAEGERNVFLKEKYYRSDEVAGSNDRTISSNNNEIENNGENEGEEVDTSKKKKKKRLKQDDASKSLQGVESDVKEAMEENVSVNVAELKSKKKKKKKRKDVAEKEIQSGNNEKIVGEHKQAMDDGVDKNCYKIADGEEDNTERKKKKKKERTDEIPCMEDSTKLDCEKRKKMKLPDDSEEQIQSLDLEVVKKKKKKKKRKDCLEIDNGVMEEKKRKVGNDDDNDSVEQNQSLEVGVMRKNKKKKRNYSLVVDAVMEETNKSIVGDCKKKKKKKTVSQ